MLLEDFPLPSLSLLSNARKGKIGAIKCLQALEKDGKISEDICLSFDKMYLQKRDEYFGGGLIGSDKNVKLYKVITSFMKVGLNES